MPWPKGKKHSPETLQKCRLSKLGEKNGMWKGDKVGYNPLHLWVKSRLPKPELCEYCLSAVPYDLANVTGNYNRDFKNWKYLCRKCHMKSDGRVVKVLKNLRQYRNRT